MPEQNADLVSDNSHHLLNASFRLAGYLLEAPDEVAAILVAMRAGADLLGAAGCAFIPLNEWAQTLPALKYGEVSFLKSGDWQTRLSAPATRHSCRVCESRQAGSDCILLPEQAEAKNIFCVGLRCGGRDVGIISYFFLAPPQVSNEHHMFLAEMVRLTDLALGTLRINAQQIEAASRVSTPVELEKKLASLDAGNRELLEQLEYKAVLDERTRLAREIHDGLAQTLALLKMEAARMQSCISKGEVDTVTTTLQACYQTLSDAYLDARQAIDNLRRVPAEELNSWLQIAAGDFETLTGISVDVSNVRINYTFSPGMKIQLIRIVQEALTNVRKHAQACAVIISAFEQEMDVILEVHDNGQGFLFEETQPVSQYGLRSMRERAESIEADFQIISAPGNGTTVRLQIPVKEKAGS